jgi:hypothetical protein
VEIEKEVEVEVEIEIEGREANITSLENFDSSKG